MQKMEFKPLRTSALLLALLALALVIGVATVDYLIIIQLSMPQTLADGTVIPAPMALGEVIGILSAVNSIAGVLIGGIVMAIGKLSEDGEAPEDPEVTKKKLELQQRRLELEEAKLAGAKDVVIVERTKARAQRTR